MKLLLIRHGESQGNAENIFQGQGEWPLSELGRAQARCLAVRLAAEFESISAIYSSTLSRALETAYILAQATGAPIIPDERLVEYDVGQLTGLTLEQVEQRFPEVGAAWKADHGEWVMPPGGETYDHFAKRVHDAFAEIIARHAEDDYVAVVSHGGTLGVYLCQAMGIPPGGRSPFAFGNACLTIVDLSRRRPRLRRHNDGCHLNGVRDVTSLEPEQMLRRKPDL